MKRRDFMSWFGLGLMATSLPIVVAACQSSDESSEPDTAASPEGEERPEIEFTPREDGFTPVGYVSDLDSEGYVAEKSVGASGIAVIRDPENAEGVVAVTSMCPHQGCHVGWDKDATAFVCPCHGSKFDAKGGLQDGPAEKPLEAVEAIVDGDLVLVKV